MAEFKVGDVVVLKSKGPRMVVTDMHRDTGNLYCEWFVEHAEVKGHTFPPGALKKLDDERL